MPDRSRSLIAPVLILLMGMGVGSMETTLPPMGSTGSTSWIGSTTPGVEGRSEEIFEISDISTQIPKVYPVYPEYRTNTEKPVKGSAKDSYLDALEYSHTKKQRDGVIRMEKPKGVKLIRRNYEGPIYRPATEYGVPGGLFSPGKNPRIAYGPTPEPFIPTPSSSYSLPVQNFVKFGEQNPYGSGVQSQSHYGPPAGSYGPPGVTSGAPASYGTPQLSQQGWSGYALPEIPQLPALPSFDIAWPLAIKLNAFTIAKIILKLVIFKLIVKFIAIICLLMFIPKLEMKSDKDDMDDDEGRKLVTYDSAMLRINALTAVVHDAIDKYQGADNHSEECRSITCRVKRLLGAGDTWRDYVRTFNSYVAEEKEDTNDMKT
ncbi:uncharacterized protein [Fopius arisanus]|uniref:Uncharacterized protein n=1 Tax=Fopius arisanus TaxID=64838 RepID=A0A9R1TZ89_9HYME|nr:PREDICTED: uncharacterized protein LOC105265556 [Fopius arisanus]